MNNTAWIVLATIAFYFVLLFVISWITGRKADNAGFFTGNRKSPWYMVAIAMTGASISGVTFISVPGSRHGWRIFLYADGARLFCRIDCCGACPDTDVLSDEPCKHLRLFGKSIWLGFVSHGAWFFFVSKMLGASVRFFVVCVVLQTLVFEPLHMPFALNVILTVALIWLYSFKEG